MQLALFYSKAACTRMPFNLNKRSDNKYFIIRYLSNFYTISIKLTNKCDKQI